MSSTIASYGLALLFVLILLESAGLPLPGETALIATAILASNGHFPIVAVIVVAAAAAIIGDNGGYYVGRRWGRKILSRWEWLARLHARAEQAAVDGRGARLLATPLALGFRLGLWLNELVERGAAKLIPPSERFFEKHGPKTVFIGRFVAILRFTAAWMAGVAGMSWWKFFFWNATGGIAWATLVSLVAYYAGQAAADAVEHYGVVAGLPIAAGVILVVVLVHRYKKKAVGEKPAATPEG